MLHHIRAAEWLCEFIVQYIVCCEESTLLESVLRSRISLSSGVVGLLHFPRVWPEKMSNAQNEFTSAKRYGTLSL